MGKAARSTERFTRFCQRQQRERAPELACLPVGMLYSILDGPLVTERACCADVVPSICDSMASSEDWPAAKRSQESSTLLLFAKEAKDPSRRRMGRSTHTSTTTCDRVSRLGTDSFSVQNACCRQHPGEQAVSSCSVLSSTCNHSAASSCMCTGGASTLKYDWLTDCEKSGAEETSAPEIVKARCRANTDNGSCSAM